jgi:hypothetical protein
MWVPRPGRLAFGMGILLGLLYEHVGINASMAAHAAFDPAALLIIWPVLPTFHTPHQRPLPGAADGSVVWPIVR